MWIAWVGDEQDYSEGGMCAWPCGCTAQVEWVRKAPTEFRFEVKTSDGVTRGRIVVAGGCTPREGLRRAQQTADAVHNAHHGEE